MYLQLHPFIFLSSSCTEYGLGTRVTTKGDVYSFGIGLLELMIRRRPADPSFDNGLNLHKLAGMALVDQDHMMALLMRHLLKRTMKQRNLKMKFIKQPIASIELIVMMNIAGRWSASHQS
ncbi:hypothetical protein Droror1_Dr00004426 [Drosera rotundifolia]